jgi:hypothetical protein
MTQQASATVTEGMTNRNQYSYVYLFLTRRAIDMDALVFGEAPILRYFFAPHRPILRIDPQVARRELRLSKKAFIDLCILCGTDFSSTIRGIGAVRALEYMQLYGSIEAMLPHLPAQYTPNENFLYREAREVGIHPHFLFAQTSNSNSLQVFQSLPDIPNIDMHEPVINGKVASALLDRYDIDADEVEERLQLMSLHHNQSNQAGWGADPFANTTTDIT